MKNQSTEAMVTHIRAILEQNQNPADLVGRDDVRTLSIEAMIANFLEEAVSMAVDNADEMLFQSIDYESFSTGGSSSRTYYYKTGNPLVEVPESEAKDENGLKSGYSSGTTSTGSISNKTFTIPQECQRILQISGAGWKGVVKDLIEKSSPIYRMCQNSYFLAVGVKDRPVAFKDFNGSSRQVSFFPEASSITLAYIKKPKISNGNIPCDDMIYEGACFWCAYLVAMVQGWASANTYRQEAIEALKVVNADNVRAAAAKMAQG